MKICPLCDTAYPDTEGNCPRDGAMLVGMRELPQGYMVRGKYRIVRKIGQGGMGTVYLAEDTFLNAAMALKFLSVELSSDPSFTQRFRNEARATFRLRHPNIVEVTGLDQADDGSLFIAMEYIDGVSLRSVMEQAHGPLAIPRVMKLVRGIASGLGAAHKMGFVHRDVKPENIIVCGQGEHEQPKILDFGIVASMERAKAEEAEAERLSRAPILTAKYAAPEQWGFLRPDQLDGRTDLYALGCVFYEMLAGRPPFEAISFEGWMGQHLKVEPARPSTYNPEIARYPRLDELVLWLLQKDREHRPSNVEALLAGMESVNAEVRQAPTPRPAPPFAQPAPAAHARPSGSDTIMEQPGTYGYAPPASRQEPTVFDRPHTPPPSTSQGTTSPVTGSPVSRSWLPWALLALLIVGAGAYGWTHRQDTPVRQAVEDSSAHSADPPTPPHIDPPPDHTPPHPDDAKNSTPPVNTGKTPAPPDSTAHAGARTTTILPVLSAGALTRQGTAAFNQGDYAHAGKAYEQACSMNSAASCRLLADMYAKGQGFPNNPDKVADLRTQSCDGGDMAGCFELSFNYNTGEGVPRDYHKVEALRTRACDGGYPEACTKLGAFYMSQEGFKDPQKSAQAFQKGCNDGSREGCWFIGKMYEIGQGVIKDPAKARESYTRSCTLGYDKACQDLHKLSPAGGT